mmetsp:Transcript_19708/g.40184  ORF Transcript_19708/g.40184 Transcript_19708/m.40184 type:complete len:262 (-) Transcript_19708:1348-2133(-)
MRRRVARCGRLRFPTLGAHRLVLHHFLCHRALAHVGPCDVEIHILFLTEREPIKFVLHGGLVDTRRCSPKRNGFAVDNWHGEGEDVLCSVHTRLARDVDAVERAAKALHEVERDVHAEVVQALVLAQVGREFLVDVEVVVEALLHRSYIHLLPRVCHRKRVPLRLPLRRRPVCRAYRHMLSLAGFTPLERVEQQVPEHSLHHFLVPLHQILKQPGLRLGLGHLGHVKHRQSAGLGNRRPLKALAAGIGIDAPCQVPVGVNI